MGPLIFQSLFFLPQQADEHNQRFQPSGLALQLIAYIRALKQAHHIQRLSVLGILRLVFAGSRAFGNDLGAVPQLSLGGIRDNAHAAAVALGNQIIDIVGDGPARRPSAAGGDINQLASHNFRRSLAHHKARPQRAGDHVAFFQRRNLACAAGYALSAQPLYYCFHQRLGRIKRQVPLGLFPFLIQVLLNGGGQGLRPLPSLLLGFLQIGGSQPG